MLSDASSSHAGRRLRICSASFCLLCENHHADRAFPLRYEYGNWTRFINHTCANEDVDFGQEVIGSRIHVTVTSSRPIVAFREVTINYGDAYFGLGQRGYCLCGEKKVRPSPVFPAPEVQS